jgi:SAM-dependent methyltransferase
VNPEEYARLDDVDQRHWFYRGKRAVVQHWIGRYLKLRPDDLLIDGGCGTGTFLVEMSATCRVLGLDAYPESVALARPRLEAVGGRVLQTDLDRVDLPDGCASVITLLDVLEHLDDDSAALAEMLRLLRPGGLLVVTVPALRWLWSDWDVALHHRRRYSRSGLRRLIDHPEAEVLRCAYFNSLLLPPIALVRLWRKIRSVKPGARRAEDSIPPGWLNWLLYHTMVGPACWRWFRPPLGVSLLAVLRRKVQAGRNVNTSPGREALTPAAPAR